MYIILKQSKWEEQTGVIVVVLLEAQDELGAMSEQLLLEGSERRTFSCSNSVDPQSTLHHRHPCLLPDICQWMQTCRVPLRQSEFACRSADLILVEAGQQFSAHFDVGASVAPLLVVIWRRKNCDNLEPNGWGVISLAFLSVFLLFTTIRVV